MTYDEFSQRFVFDPDTHLLGTGGFGKVYKATDTWRHQVVALKIAPVEPGMEAFSLLSEFKRVKDLEHPNIVFYHACQRLGFPFMGQQDVAWMQYYEAGHLGQLLERERLSTKQKNDLLLGILKGIEFLHGLHPECIIHCDLKPENILIHREEQGLVPLITDFGISRMVDAVRSRVSNIIKAFSLHFAAPELLDGESIRRNVDLWSFGVLVAYVWLDGQLPFRTEGLNLTSESGIKQMQGRIRALDLVPAVSTIPALWQQVLRHCLVIDPEMRLNSCPEVRNLLNEKTRVLNPEDLFAQGRAAEDRKEYRAAQQYYKKAADQHHAGAMYQLGCLYDNGQGGTLDKIQARTWWARAASLGNANAQQRMRDVDRENKADRPAVLGGNPLPPGVHKKPEELDNKEPGKHSLLRSKWIVAVGIILGSLLLGGLLYQRLIPGPTPTPDAPATLALSTPVTADSTTVAPTTTTTGDTTAYSTPATASAPAPENADDIVSRGTDAEEKKHYKTAKYYYEQAVKLGSADGIYFLGNLYYNGRGVRQNYPRARALFQQGATLKESSSMYMLGVMYEYGDGVKKSTAQARIWYQKAANLGDFAAKKSLQELTIAGGINQKGKDGTEAAKSEQRGFQPADYQYSTTLTESTIGYMLRDKPDINAKQIYECPKESTIYVLDDKGLFFKVSVDGHIGYIFKNLTNYLSTTIAPISFTDYRPARFVRSAHLAESTIGYPLRSSPSLDATQIYECPRSSTVYVLEELSNHFIKASVNGHVGYMNDTFISKR